MTLIHNGCMLQVYERLQKLNLSMSHSQLLRLVDKLGWDYDAKVKNWQASLIFKMNTSASAQVHVHYRSCMDCTVYHYG